MANGFDCATKLTSATAKSLKDACFEYAARYLGNSWKSFDAKEAAIIKAAGLKLVSVFQKSANHSGYHTKTQGISDAKEAYQYAKNVGQPVGSAIYFAVDFDAQSKDMPCIIDYFTAVKENLKEYKVGVYGSYAVVNALKGKVDYYWQTYAWSKGKIADFIHMHQFQNDIKVAGICLDKDDIKKNPGSWDEMKKQSEQLAATEPIKWDGMELKPGQIGRITITKPINLWKRNGNKLEMVRILQPGEVYRVYSFDDLHGGQYGVGSGFYVTNMPDRIRYETPSKAMLEHVNK